MVERYRIFAFTTFYRADSMPRPYPAAPRAAHIFFFGRGMALPVLSICMPAGSRAYTPQACQTVPELRASASASSGPHVPPA